MRAILLCTVLGLVLGSWTNQVEASWLSQALKARQEQSQHIPPIGYGYAPSPSVPGGYCYQQLPPSVPPLIPNIAGTWYLSGNPYARCQVIQWRLDGYADFINEYGDRSWGTVRGDQVWAAKWSDGTSSGLSGWIRGNRILWANGTFWSR